MFFTLLLLGTQPSTFIEWEMPQASVIVNVHTHTLALIESRHVEEIHSVATGKKGDETPLGKFTVRVKAKNPYYRKKNIAGGAPNNPLGSRWIGFDALGTEGRTYGLHGTNRPGSIGYRVSAGCIRLANESVERLYERLEVGSTIVIVDEKASFEAIGKKYGLL
ncbi:L,D-transpeptidase catalytic domain [Shouchella lonarensis]|uniref:L,D-transpeptidase catalytic domain n=1 Tax=Shouchella lonarensis TaxID=1464122 RepID=A0A1G6IWP5_9BACI|nr:L,D-transpeptidase catalytic domain [Shouchella lonarensis]